MQRIWKDYFRFSKKERSAVIILLLLMSGFLAVPYLYTPAVHAPEPSQELLNYFAAADSSEKPVGTPYPAERVTDRLPAKAVVFPFDPNTLDAEGWSRLGIAGKTIRTILNYRGKGGRFRKPEDIGRIWGMLKQDADRLIPYVRIGMQENTAAAPHTTGVKKAITPIDINTAGMEEWKALPGIGDVIAARIIRFREKTGGFISVEQVGKTYGLRDSVFAQISPYLRFNPASLPAIHINQVSAYELRMRLNMPYKMANEIIRLRDLNGPFRSVSEINKAIAIPDSLWQKLILRLTTE